MKILIVRHGDPDYSIDSLTEKGEREAKLLAGRLVPALDRDGVHLYCSPLGRAQKTASYTLKGLGRTAETLQWLREFDGMIKDENGRDTCCWDRLPSAWTDNDLCYSADWANWEPYRNTNVEEEYRWVCVGLDELLARHGYRHNGRHFDVTNANSDTVVLFCHFGVESVMLSHFFGVSPMVFWHNTGALTTSVTTLVTEERQEGYAIFRMLCYGDLSHLWAAGEEPSFQARFCECYTDPTRH